MIWKIIVILSVALHVQGEDDAVSEQRVVIHHQTSFRKSLSHIGPNRSGNQDAYARAYPSYEFSYNVNDPKTRDIKGQHETREGDEVIGNYWLIEPNGRKRTVNYQANDDIGFNAQIDYTAALTGEKKSEDVSVSQGIVQGDSEKNNEEVEISVSEEIQENQDSDNASRDNGSLPTAEENSLSDESDNQEDEANNINNVERVNIDSKYDGNISRSNQNVNNVESDSQKSYDRKLNASPRRNNSINDTRKSKREKLKKNKNQDRASWGNDNDNNNRSRNNNHIKQDDSKQYENNGRIPKKVKKSNRDKNLNTLQNNDNSNVNKEQVDKVQKENVRKQNDLRDEEIDEHNEDNVRNNKSYAVINLAPVDEIQRKIDIPKKEDTYEHRIRIHHPKNILAKTSKEEQRRKH